MKRRSFIIGAAALSGFSTATVNVFASETSKEEFSFLRVYGNENFSIKLDTEYLDAYSSYQEALASLVPKLKVDELYSRIISSISDIKSADWIAGNQVARRSRRGIGYSIDISKVTNDFDLHLVAYDHKLTLKDGSKPDSFIINNKNGIFAIHPDYEKYAIMYHKQFLSPGVNVREYD